MVIRVGDAFLLLLLLLLLLDGDQQEIIFIATRQHANITCLPPAFDFIAKKTGHTFSADQSEKITDGVRGLYEKQTGYVPSAQSADPA
jgi:hypothetical protein